MKPCPQPTLLPNIQLHEPGKCLIFQLIWVSFLWLAAKRILTIYLLRLLWGEIIHNVWYPGNAQDMSIVIIVSIIITMIIKYIPDALKQTVSWPILFFRPGTHTITCFSFLNPTFLFQGPSQMESLLRHLRFRVFSSSPLNSYCVRFHVFVFPGLVYDCYIIVSTGAVYTVGQLNTTQLSLPWVGSGGGCGGRQAWVSNLCFLFPTTT